MAELNCSFVIPDSDWLAQPGFHLRQYTAESTTVGVKAELNASFQFVLSVNITCTRHKSPCF